MTTPATPLRAPVDRLTCVWFGLMLATVLAWLFGPGSADHRLASAAIVAVAFAKVRWVGLDFMELRRAPKALRFAFEAWVLAVVGALIALCVF